MNAWEPAPSHYLKDNSDRINFGKSDTPPWNATDMLNGNSAELHESEHSKVQVYERLKAASELYPANVDRFKCTNITSGTAYISSGT